MLNVIILQLRGLEILRRVPCHGGSNFIKFAGAGVVVIILVVYILIQFMPGHYWLI